jgi:hypothetical protein
MPKECMRRGLVSPSLVDRNADRDARPDMTDNFIDSSGPEARNSL